MSKQPKLSLAAFCFRILNLDMAEYHQEMCKVIQDNRLSVIMAPRQHGKTEVGTIAQALYYAYYAKKPEMIVMVSSVDKQAGKLMDRVRYHIENNPVLKEKLLPKSLYKARWGANEIDCKNSVQIKSYPLSSSVRGLPVDHMMLDDVLRDDVGAMGKTKKLFNEAVFPTISATKGTLSVVGTPQSYVDLLHDLMAPEQTMWAKLKYSAVILDDEGKWVRALWPTRYSLEELEVTKNTVGTVAWSKEYMCNPITGGSSLYPWDLIEKSIVEGLDKEINVSEDKQYFLAADIALSSKKSADFSVYTIGERKGTGPLKVVKVLRFKGKPLDEQASVVASLNDRFNFSKIVVEQAGLGYDFPEKLIQNYSSLASKVIGFKTTRVAKERILGGLEIAFRNGALLIPKNDILIEELLAFGVKVREDGHGGFTQTYEGLGAHDDCVMSLAMLVEAGSVGATVSHIEMV